MSDYRKREEKIRTNENLIKAKKWWSAALSMLLVTGIALPAPQTASAAEDNSSPVISQVYGGGGNSGAKYKNDFIELYNPTDTAVDLTGWKVRYASSAGSFGTNNIPLAGTLPANGYYLIMGAGGNTGDALPTPDLIPSSLINLSATNGKVDLLNSTDTQVDLIGYGTANFLRVQRRLLP